METTVSVRETMTRDPVTSPPDTSVVELAKTMFMNNIGSVIISNNGDDEGIVTERDICYKVVAQDKDPSKTLAREIMSTSLVSISPDKSITDAAKLMVKKSIRRLAVVEGGKVIGIITASDILAVSPKTIEVLRELYDIYSNEDQGSLPPESPEEGTCDECGTFTDSLTPANGRYLCDDCREDIEG